MNQQQIDMIMFKLKHGEHVVVQEEGGILQIISPLKDSNGNYRRSGRSTCVESAKNSIGSFGGKPNLEEELKDLTYIDSFILDYPPVPAGTLIKFKPVEEVERLCIERGFMWSDEKDDIVKRRYALIKRMQYNYYMIEEGDLVFPREAFTIAMPEGEIANSRLREFSDDDLVAELELRKKIKDVKAVI